MRVAILIVAALCVQQAVAFSSLFAGNPGHAARRSVGALLRPSAVSPPKSLRAASTSMMAETGASSKGKLLVLGGTGFAGSKIVEYALGQGYEVVALSRRGRPAPGSALEGKSGLDWRSGDATKPEEVEAIVKEGGFTGVVHAIGMLLEGEANKLASGSGSIPTPGATYDDITRKTAFNLMQAFAADASASGPIPPFAFISAAEARWDFDQYFKGTPAEWLHRYLIAKRAVEDELSALGEAKRLRPIIVRPSLIWSWENPGALPPVAAFTVANKIGVPFIDKPVTVDEVAKAIVYGLEAEAEAGIFDFRGMQRLATSLRV